MGSRDKFSDTTGKRPFLINFKGLDQGYEDSSTIFIKKDLGREILNILRGTLEDEMPGHMMAAKFYLNVTIYSQCDPTPERKAKLFKTAKPAFMNPVTVREMSLREQGIKPVEYYF